MYPFSCISTPYPLTELSAASIDGSSEQGQYDYIIVGGGTAGCVLANRLSEDPSVKVLLLERGDARLGWATRVPLLSTNFMGDESVAYIWPSTPMKNLAESRSLNLVTSKGLGGGSAINSMQYTRGFPMEYDLWSEAGRKGWSFKEVEPYFSKSERFVCIPERQHHGTEGEWTVRDTGLYFSTALACVDACEALGLPYAQDLNDPSVPLTVCGKLDSTIDMGGRRNSTFHAFLPEKLASERKSHLHICTGAAVTALDIEEDKNQKQVVKGVTFQAAKNSRSEATLLHARARREVILCAGAIATPQILLQSGIGAVDKIKKPLKKALPGVGENLQDHMATVIMYTVPTAQSLHILQASRLTAIIELFRYVAFGEGLFLAPATQHSILVHSALIDDSGHIISPNPSDPARLPDLELMPIHFNYSDHPTPPIEVGVFSLKVGLMRPASRGSVTLASDNPLDHPACDLAFLSNPADYAVMRKGVKLAKRIGEMMRRELGKDLKDLYMPESESVADLDAFIRKTARSTYHYGCTCRMAPEDDPRPGVVDDELRVHGIANLRIADCSVIPDMLSTHLQAPAVMIAEKCADMVRAQQSLDHWQS